MVQQNAGVFFGRTLVQQRGTIGGSRNVFVKLQGGAKNDLVHPTNGMKVLNPFKGVAKAYAGDLVEYRMDGTGYLLKTYEVADANSATTVYIKRDGYRHIPFVGDVLMKAQDTFEGTAKAYTITSVVAGEHRGKDVWTVTFNTEIDAVDENDILVEAESESASGTALVKNPNMVLASDYDFLYSPVVDPSGYDDFDNARYLLTPVFSELAYVSKMSPIPPAVKELNKSRVVGWFKI